MYFFWSIIVIWLCYKIIKIWGENLKGFVSGLEPVKRGPILLGPGGLYLGLVQSCQFLHVPLLPMFLLRVTIRVGVNIFQHPANSGLLQLYQY